MTSRLFGPRRTRCDVRTALKLTAKQWNQIIRWTASDLAMRSAVRTSRCALLVPGVGPGRAARPPGRALACSCPPPFLSDRFCSLAGLPLVNSDSQVGKRVGLFTRLRMAVPAPHGMY